MKKYCFLFIVGLLLSSFLLLPMQQKKKELVRFPDYVFQFVKPGVLVRDDWNKDRNDLRNKSLLDYREYQQCKDTYTFLMPNFVEKLPHMLDCEIEYVIKRLNGNLRGNYLSVYDKKSAANQINKFVTSFKERIKNRDDSFLIASFAHMSLNRIQPFSKANGRTARALMNLVLAASGRKPIAFFSAKEYSQVVQQSENDPEKFARYLRVKEDEMIALERAGWFEHTSFCKKCKKLILEKKQFCDDFCAQDNMCETPELYDFGVSSECHLL